MNTPITNPATLTTPMPRARVVRAYAEETRAEILRYLRSPGFMAPMLAFSSVFYVMFGIVLSRGNAEVQRYLLAAYATFAVMGPGLFGFGVSLGVERGSGLLTLKRALPMPPLAYLLGKMVMAMLMAAIVMALLLCLGIFAAHVSLSVAQILTMFVVGVFGVLPFCALGLLIGTLAKGQAAAGVVNLVYLPMAFLSGLWFPLSILPKVLQHLAPVWPSYHLDRLALAALGFDVNKLWLHILMLLGFTAVFLLLASWRLRRHG
jgi:ABC-2 type transport system permease protein